MTTPEAVRIDYSLPDWRERLLETRARSLAGNASPESEAGEILKCLIVLANGAPCALRLSDVAQVTPWREPARLPGGRGAVGGRSGSYFHIYSLADLLGGSGDQTAGGHIVRLRVRDRGVALRVDRAMDVADVRLVQPDVSESLGKPHPAAVGLGEAPGYPTLTILDADRLFRPASLQSFEVE